jgi:hypothetical protein
LFNTDEATIIIKDIVGREILRQSLINKQTLIETHLAAGTYTVEVKNEKEILLNTKLIVVE